MHSKRIWSFYHHHAFALEISDRIAGFSSLRFNVIEVGWSEPMIALQADMELLLRRGERVTNEQLIKEQEEVC